MLIKRRSSRDIPSSEITPERVYLSRREFMQGVGAATAVAAAFLVGCRPERPNELRGAAPGADVSDVSTAVQATADELGDPLTDYQSIVTYNNYYEFSTNKDAVADLAKNFPVDPWQITVDGLVGKPQVFDLDDLRRFDQEERIYRLRCVEAWSMVIPWLGFPLGKLLAEVEPLAEATHVRFETVLDRENMPGLRQGWYDWPYVEGLRLDEAMHDLTLLSTGLYGRELLPQNGAPVRLVVPWKYGFKSIKSIVRIELVNYQPDSLWMQAAPSEYGFYANVNPEVAHPRWSQATERRIGEFGRRDTLMFNGYEEEVAHLYTDLDLRRNY